jgi:hypothetical protein
MMQSAEGAQIEMPRYACHKEVWALKIALVVPADRPTLSELEALLESDGLMGRQPIPGARLIFTDPRYAPIDVDRDFLDRHNPEEGGYYVVYKDGYKSFSPAEAFEEGYTKI